MESALRDCCLGIKIGKILVQRQGHSGYVSGNSDNLPPLSIPELSAKLVRLCAVASVGLHCAAGCLLHCGPDFIAQYLHSRVDTTTSRFAVLLNGCGSRGGPCGCANQHYCRCMVACSALCVDKYHYPTIRKLKTKCAVFEVSIQDDSAARHCRMPHGREPRCCHQARSSVSACRPTHSQ